MNDPREGHALLSHTNTTRRPVKSSLRST